MPDVTNRALGPPKPSQPDSPLAAVWRAIEVLAKKHIDLSARVIRDGRDGIDGRDADPEMIRQMVAEEVAKAMAAMPQQRARRTTVTKHDEHGRVLEFVQEDVCDSADEAE